MGREFSADLSGRYICRTDYGTIIVPDTLYVYFLVDRHTAIDYITTTGAKIGRPQQFVLRLPPEILAHATYTWTVTEGGTIISANDTLTVVWNTVGEKYIFVDLAMNYGGVNCTKTLSRTIMITERGLGFYVNRAVVGGNHDGSSWANAYGTIEDALSTATSGDRIWVARGTYYPDALKGSFVIQQDSIEIFGGFEGSEAYLYERNTQHYPTIMQGDGRHPVVTVENSAGIRVDGFTITNGHADNGAGVLFTSGSTGTLANDIIKQNIAIYQGGGLYASAPWYGYEGVSLINDEISGNQAATGGGIYNEGGMQLLHATVSGNRATSVAGGMYNNSKPLILNSIIWGNVAPGNVTPTDDATKDVLNVGGSPLYIHSLIGGSNGSSDWQPAFGIDGGGNRDTNPIFLHKGVEDDGVTLREGNYHLSANSMAVNTGNTYLTLHDVFTPWDIWLPDPRQSLTEGLPMDLDNNARISDDDKIDMVDMGAYEYNSKLIPTGLEREVILPSVSDVVTEPGAGIHYVLSLSDFTFRVIPSSRYAGEPLAVTTSRIRIPDSEGVKIVKNADGSYDVTIFLIQDKTEVFISFFDIHAGNESLSGSRVWAYRNELHVKSAAGTLRIYTLSGRLFKQQPLAAGETIIPLPQGVYVISIDDSGMKQKVIIR
jgi:hypothetical protein